MKIALISALLVGGALFLSGATNFSWGSASASDDLQTNFYPSGQMQSRAVRIKGVREGAASEWYANGQERCTGQYQAGQREGAWVFFNADGSVDNVRTGSYAAGQRIAP